MEENFYTPAQDSTNSSPTPLPQITLESLEYLDTAAKWAKFLAILGFIGIGFMALAGLFMGAFFTFSGMSEVTSQFPFPMGIFGFVYLIMAAAYVMPVIYLNNFANYISKAVALRETVILTEALLNLKRNFKYVGIMTIVGIASYFVLIAVFVILIVTNTLHRF